MWMSCSTPFTITSTSQTVRPCSVSSSTDSIQPPGTTRRAIRAASPESMAPGALGVTGAFGAAGVDGLADGATAAARPVPPGGVLPPPLARATPPPSTIAAPATPAISVVLRILRPPSPGPRFRSPCHREVRPNADRAALPRP